MKKQIILILLSLGFIFCSPQPPRDKNSSRVLHVDEIYMQYNQDYFYLPMLKAMVNDSLHYNVLFDTGVPGKYIIASDSLKSYFPVDSASVQIGKQKMQMGIDFIDSKRMSVFNIFGNNMFIVGWEFFDKKIIEISFDKQYIRVYEYLPDVADYDRLKITVSPSSHLQVPIEAVLQGRTIKEKAIIDTGNNSYASFSSQLIDDYKIDMQAAYEGKAMTNAGLLSGYSLPVDTIKIAGIGIAYPNMRVAFRSDFSGRKAPNLIGNKSLEKLSVVMDLINYELYLKPIGNMDKNI